MQQLANLYPQVSTYEREVHIVLMRPSRNKDKRKRKEKDVFTVAACAPEELQETLAGLKTYKSYDYLLSFFMLFDFLPASCYFKVTN